MTWIDWFAFVVNVLCVYLIVREKDVNWPIGVAGSVLLLVVFTHQKLYAQVILQLFYIVEGLYGWWMWTRRDKVTRRKLIRIGKTKAATAILLTLISIPLTAACYFLFRQTEDPAPFWDSLITVASLAAEYMLCLKLLESWALYLAADIVSLILFAFLGAWAAFGTYLAFIFLCVMGIIAWRKSLKTSQLASSSESSTPSPAAISS